MSATEVADIPFTAFSSRKQTEPVVGCLVVRRIPELNPKATQNQPTLFDMHRFHAFFTTVTAATLDIVAAAKVHRKHARIEQVNAMSVGQRPGPPRGTRKSNTTGSEARPRAAQNHKVTEDPDSRNLQTGSVDHRLATDRASRPVVATTRLVLPAATAPDSLASGPQFGQERRWIVGVLSGRFDSTLHRLP